MPVLLQSEKIRSASVFCVLAILFFISCLHYTSILNLWGDEAVSLVIADMPFHNIIRNIDVHAPTYYLYLKAIMSFTGSTYIDETTIRWIHTLFFMGGLYFGWQIVQLLFNKKNTVSLIAIGTMIFVIVNPTYLFYATNIRMYAFYYLFAMWYLYSVMKYLSQSDPITFRCHWPILLSGTLLIGLDYIGLLYYSIGALFVIYKSRYKLDWKLGLFIGLPLLALIAYLPILFPAIKMMLAWSHGAVSVPKSYSSWVATASGIIFNVGRPFVELTNISYKNIVFPLVSLCGFGLCFLWGTWRVIKTYRLSNDLKMLFILVISYVWLLTIFLGSSITRIFLPSQFFMSILILYGLMELRLSKKYCSLLFLGLITFNVYLIVFPISRFSSIIPYHSIAQNIDFVSDQLGVRTVLISNNSLNSESVVRYLNQKMDSKLDIHKISDITLSSDIPKQPFLFLSYMDENNQFVDASRFATLFNRKVRCVNNYVQLDALQYNAMWKNNIAGRTHQKYAYIAYLVS